MDATPRHAAPEAFDDRPDPGAPDAPAAHDAPEDPEGAAPAVTGRALAMTGEEGPVYGPVDVDVPGTGLTILTGRGGSGRTALALTLAGRMRPDSGELTVLGETGTRAIRRRVAIAGVEQVDLLDRDVRVRHVLAEHRAWTSRWWRRVPAPDEDYLAELAGETFGPRSLPPLDAYVSQLTGADRHLLRIALALHPADGAEIGLLVVDDLEQIHEPGQRLALLSRLLGIAERIPVAVTSAVAPPEEILPAIHVADLEITARHLDPAETGVDRRLLARLKEIRR
ncbi:ATP-binding cassette domain-containing protein [Corynebacterium sphenisci]|uniref:ATP-binding cassette domain-containing protein n=1 Tax=Corynebacterium sphenisci TaxID=191493 RepID=UPI0009519AAE|nr:ATP-binding cassette domain-containing protein [Corynebacterium sphenisci]